MLDALKLRTLEATIRFHSGELNKAISEFVAEASSGGDVHRAIARTIARKPRISGGSSHRAHHKAGPGIWEDVVKRILAAGAKMSRYQLRTKMALEIRDYDRSMGIRNRTNVSIQTALVALIRKGTLIEDSEGICLNMGEVSL